MSKDVLKAGVKYDGEKLRYDLISQIALEELAKVYTMGAKKYEDHNWRKGMKWSRIFSALMRHMWAFWRGEENDSESGLSHVAHAMWNCATLLEYAQMHRKFDDRFLIKKSSKKKDK